MEQQEKKNESGELEQLMELGIAENENGIQVLSVIGQVEGHFLAPEQNKTTKYEHLLPLLVAMEESKEVKGVLILLNTMGGDVEAGLAIAELIASMETPTVSLVLGGGHSIGVPLACAAQRSFIVPTATMTLHPVRATGTIIGVPQSLRTLEEMQERVCNFIVKNSRISRERLQRLMTEVGNMVTDVGTILGGEQAAAEGLIDGVGGLKEALATLKEMIEKREESGYNSGYEQHHQS
ncbi:MAG: ATP-dependent Clp protease proteolytic subunit [Clostridia bacterium]|nr:ATP-dependent Clp protease proteolytic subunit [Clostridia bacterium]